MFPIKKMAARGWKKATASNEKESLEHYPPPEAIPLSDGENSYESQNVSGDFGVIIVKNYNEEKRKQQQQQGQQQQQQREHSTRDHRGINREKMGHRDGYTTGIVDRLTAALNGVCVQGALFSNMCSVTEEALVDDISVDVSEGLRQREQGNAIQKFAKEVQERQDISILTDVSFLSDSSMRDLSLQRHDDTMLPVSPGNARNLPFFRKKYRPTESQPSLLQESMKNQDCAGCHPKRATPLHSFERQYRNSSTFDSSDCKNSNRISPRSKEKAREAPVQKKKRRSSSRKNKKRSKPVFPHERPDIKRLV